MEQLYYRLKASKLENGESVQVNRFFKLDQSDRDKYVVCTCARGENQYIVEFVEHYLSIGFDKVFIFDNNDDNSIESVLSDFTQNGSVEIFDCRGLDSFQVQVYSMFCEEGNYKWCAYFDADEFLELGCYSNIKDLLQNVNEDTVSFHWILYGHNNLSHNDKRPLCERFTKPKLPLLNKENAFVKTIVRGGTSNFIESYNNGAHIPIYFDGKEHNFNIGMTNVVNYSSQDYFPPRYKYAYIKHYYTKSFDEWAIKASRGWPDGTPKLDGAKFAYFENNNMYLDDEWNNALFLPRKKLETEIKDIIDNIEPYKLIVITNDSNTSYGILIKLILTMLGTNNKIFVVKSNSIDDTLFTVLLEYAFKTNNKVVYAKDDFEMSLALNKYLSVGDNYYIYDFS